MGDISVRRNLIYVDPLSHVKPELTEVLGGRKRIKWTGPLHCGQTGQLPCWVSFRAIVARTPDQASKRVMARLRGMRELE